MTRLRAAREPALIATVVIGALVLWHAPHFQHITSDTFSVLTGVGVIDRCLHAHEWSCGTAGFGGVGPSALLQYLPGLAFKRLGMSYSDAAHGLVWVNTISFALILILLWRTGRRIGDVRMASLLVLIAAAGPLLWYSSAGFGEGFGAFAVTAFTCAAVVRARGVVLAATLWLAAISKEPALPFLLALAFVTLRQPPTPGRPPVRRTQIAGLAIGAVVAFATSIAFNAFRASEGAAAGARPLTASIRNVVAPAPTLLQKAEAAISLIFAPNVGLLWFWPVALLCITVGVLAARPSGRRGLARVLQSPAGGSLIIFLVFVAGTASFPTPYGFSAFGPRYLVPWLPSFALVALSDWPSCAAVLDRLRARAVPAMAIGVAIFVLACSQLAAFLNPGRAYAHFNAGGDCPTPLSDINIWYRQYGDVDSYYACTRYLAWRKGPILANVDKELGSVSSLAYLLAYGGALVVLIAGAAFIPRRGELR